MQRTPRRRSWVGALPAAPAALVALASLVSCAVVELWFARADQPIGFDESYIGSLALRLLNGHMLPGVDGVGQRGPMFYWLATIAQWLGGRYHWVGFRWLAFLAAGAVVVALLVLGRMRNRMFAGAIGGAFYVYVVFHGFDLGAGGSVNGEQLVAPLTCWATVAMGAAVRTPPGARRRRLAALAGLLIGIAGWTKITFIVAVVPLALWAWVAHAKEAGELRARARVLVPLGLGWLAPTAFVLLVYGVAGAWGDLYYRFFTYNAEIYMGPYAGASRLDAMRQWLGGSHESIPVLSCLFAGCALVAHAGYLTSALERRSFRATLLRTDIVALALAQAALAFASAIAQMRFWNHHFVAAIPWAGLLIGLGVDSLVEHLPRLSHAPLRGVLAVLLVHGLATTIGADALQRERERRAGQWGRPSRDPMCGAIHEYAKPDEPIFVWGFDGDLYVSCARRPASRYVYDTLVAGIVPPFWNERRPERVARGARTDTARDLEREKPPLVLDLPARLGNTSINDIPELRAVVSRDYCRGPQVTGWGNRRATFYLRKDRDLCPKQ